MVIVLKPNHSAKNWAHLMMILSSLYFLFKLHLPYLKSFPQGGAVTIKAAVVTTSFASTIKYNKNSTMADDISSVIHLPEESKIVIELKTKQEGGAKVNCPNPYLVARLSGPALVRITFSKINSTAMVGIYLVPVSGMYFLEVIMIFCDNFVQTKELNYNFAPVCIEDPNHNRIFDATLNLSANGAKLKTVPGYWIFKSNSSKHNNSSLNEIVPTLYTRYQPQGCRYEHKDDPECTKHTSTGRFDDYVFEWLSKGLFLPENMLQSEQVSICVFGHSHTRYLLKAFGRIGITLKGTNIRFYWGKSKYPQDVTVDMMHNMTMNYNCTKAIFGLGAWPAGYPGGKPMLFKKYYEEMKNLLERIHVAFPELELYARSVDLCSIGVETGVCPPRDWRSPAVIDGYNTAIYKACQDLGGAANNIHYVDLNFISGPMWDSARDWFHMPDISMDAEAIYLTAVLTGKISNSSMIHNL